MRARGGGFPGGGATGCRAGGGRRRRGVVRCRPRQTGRRGQGVPLGGERVGARPGPVGPGSPGDPPWASGGSAAGRRGHRSPEPELRAAGEPRGGRWAWAAFASPSPRALRWLLSSCGERGHRSPGVWGKRWLMYTFRNLCLPPVSAQVEPLTSARSSTGPLRLDAAVILQQGSESLCLFA